MLERFLQWRTRTARPPLKLSTRAARYGALAFFAGVLICAFPLGRGYLDGKRAAPALAERAEAVIAAGRGPEALGPGRWQMVLAVQDPAFYDHSGLDLSTPGAGITTVTQSLAKRVGFETFEPGWQKLRQTGLALGYETGMTKPQIAALWLETLEMGRAGGAWTVGFFPASEALFGRAPADLTERDFLSLVARLIAPGRLSRPEGAEELAERIARIERLLAGACAPRDHGDVWLDGCA